MAFTEFCCRSGGSNMNGGALASNGEPATAPVYSATNGGWNSGTGVFTPTSGNPSSSVTVGDWANVFVDGSTTPVFVGRVTAVSSTTITVSTTAKSGTAPTTAGSGVSINVGGAWAGPNAAVSFPFNFATGAMVNAAGDPCRVNFKSDVTYNITAAMTHTLIGPVTFRGYQTTFGDRQKATIDGGTTGASYILLTLSSNGVDRTCLCDLVFQNNGSTGNAAGLSGIGDPRTTLVRTVVNNVRGIGFNGPGRAIECEAYVCNQSNTTLMGGFYAASSGVLIRCIAHDNVGSNNNGFYDQAGNCNYINCISESNGLHGVFFNNVTRGMLIGCNFYGNGGSGIHSQTANFNPYIESCNFIANGAWGINIASGTAGIGFIYSCGFGSGTAANTSGQMNGTGNYTISGNVTYATNLTPWVDPANGDFRVSLADAKGAGRGDFTQTAAGYAGTVSYPDIGAVQHQDAGGSAAGILVHPGMRGGMI